MPVIIDQLDLVDTQPAPSRESSTTAERSTTATTSTVRQVLAALRVASVRAARTLAD